MHTYLVTGLLAAMLTTLSGCYIAHVAKGQASLLWARRPVAEVLADPHTPADLRQGLALVHDARDLARRLGLRVQDQYTSYVEWPGDRLVTAVVATRAGEVEPKGFWFPIVGRVPYKGFFALEAARDEAGRLRRRGLDTCLVAVPAYSTLGWMGDPVTTPMLRLSEGSLVETVLHELVHATVFVESSADFNEGIATFVGQEGSVLFFEERYGPSSSQAERERNRIEDERRIARTLGALRSRIGELYAEAPEGPERDLERKRLEREARATLARLSLPTRDAAQLAETLRLNDACLALSATYEGQLDAYRERLKALDDDLRTFLATAREAAERPDPLAVLLGPVAGARGQRGGEE
jgi:predicted aminopeptidase